MYLTAIINVYLRYIVACGLSNSLNKGIVYRCTRKGFKTSQTGIINTDQGSQHTSNEFVKLVTSNKFKLSMDSKGRALDNIWIERF